MKLAGIKLATEGQKFEILAGSAGYLLPGILAGKRMRHSGESVEIFCEVLRIKVDLICKFLWFHGCIRSYFL